MKKRYLAIAILLPLAVVGFLAGRKLIAKIPKPQVETTRPTRGDFTVNLLVEGTLESEDSVVVRTGKAAGELTMIVPDGTVIKQGDVFCRIQARELERSRLDAELAYKQAYEEIERTRQNAEESYENYLRALEQAQQAYQVWEETVLTRTAQAEEQLQFDRIELERLRLDYERIRRMAEKGYLAAAEAEIGKAAYESQRFKVEQSAKDLELNRLQIDSERRQKQSAIASAQRRADVSRSRIAGQEAYARDRATRAAKRLESIAASLADSTITAPITGTVSLFSTYRGGERRSWREGDQVRSGTPLGSISGNKKLTVRCRVKENNIATLREGQAADIDFSAVQGARFGGVVASVGLVAREVWAWEDPTAEGNVRVFDVLVSVTRGPVERLKPGLNALVNLVVQRVPNALYLPLDAVFTKEGNSYVYVKEGPDFVRREVETGERNDIAVVITRGLTGDERVALTDPTSSPAPSKRKR